jgi:hypothetical protein
MSVQLTVGDEIALIAAVLTGIAVTVALWQLRDSHKAAAVQMAQSNQYAKGQNWLLLRSVLTHYDDVHAKLRPSGDWYESSMKPDTTEDWARTELYMGVFEFAKELTDTGMLDREHLRDWYRYRIKNLLANPRIVQYKLIDHADGWRRFLGLCEDLKLQLPRPVAVGPFLRSLS